MNIRIPAALALLACSALPAGALELHLVAKPLAKAMPDGEVVPMWGFAQVDAAEFAAALTVTPATVPGPRLDLPDGDDTLTIHLRNDLPQPVSLVIPGQPAPPLPTWVDAAGQVIGTGQRPAGNATARMRSIAAETPPGGVATYAWTGLKPGTYLYRSGTLVTQQVPMGLYGAMTRNAGPGAPYANVATDGEALVVYGEVDPALNRAVADGSFGSAIHYHARYFLLNGEPFSPGRAPLTNIGVAQRLLLRLVNAGLEPHVPAILGARLVAVAEDGHPYPWQQSRHGLLLAPGKTLDAVFTAPSAGRYALYDRALSLTNAAASPGGLLTHIEAGAVSGAPVAADDRFAGIEDQALSVASPGVLGNDVGSNLQAQLVSPPGIGSLSLAPDGGFTYRPAPDYSGTVAFSYRASDGTRPSNTAAVSIQLAPVNDAPVAAGESYQGNNNETLTIPAPGLLANDRDPDGDPLSAVQGLPPTKGTLILAANGGFSYRPNANFAGSDRFTYRVGDGKLQSAEVAVALTIAQPVNTAPVAVDDRAGARQEIPVTIAVLANDRDAETNIDPTKVVIVTPPNRGGTARVNGDGTVTFQAKQRFRGTDTFSYRVSDRAGASSNIARVAVEVLR